MFTERDFYFQSNFQENSEFFKYIFYVQGEIIRGSGIQIYFNECKIWRLTFFKILHWRRTPNDIFYLFYQDSGTHLNDIFFEKPAWNESTDRISISFPGIFNDFHHFHTTCTNFNRLLKSSVISQEALGDRR